MDSDENVWEGIGLIYVRRYVCGHCSSFVSSDTGYQLHSIYDSAPDLGIYICPYCTQPTYFDACRQIPGPVLGRQIKNIPYDIGQIYDEIRKDISSECFTSAILLSRKLLMNIAIKEGAEEGRSFAYYVDNLTEEHLPKRTKDWVDKIRQMGNEANHEITSNNKQDALEMLNYLELLLLNMYEYST